MRHLLLVPLLACARPTNTSEPAPVVMALLVTESCLSASDANAIADDGISDTAQLQAAIEAAQLGPRCLALGAGRYEVMPVPLPRSSPASLRITAPVELKGAGEALTTVAMVGDAQGKDWTLLNVTARDVIISDLTLDGATRSGTTEQTHLLQLTGPTQQVRIERVTLNLPDHGVDSGGDCIRLLGGYEDRVQGTRVKHVTGKACDRSWISLQRGVRGLTIEDSKSVEVGGQAIDFEPTGGASFHCSPIIQDVTMQRLELARGSIARGSQTVAIVGQGCALAQGIRLLDSTVRDGSLFVHEADRVTIQGVTIE